MKRDEIELIAVRCRIELEQMGVGLRLVHDVNEMKDLYRQLDKSVSAAADPSQLLLTQGNCFAVFCFEGGNPILGSIIRIDDLGDEDAQSFLPRSVETIFGVKVVGATSDVYAGHKWGRTAYFGDLKTAKRAGLGQKGQRILQLSSMYGHYRAFVDYNTDLHYCFLRQSDQRYAFAYGFFDLRPFVWATDRSVYPDGNPYHIGKLSSSELPMLAASAKRILPDLFAVDQKPLLEVITKNSAGAL